MFRCLRDHDHDTEEAREECDAQTHDSTALLKMSQVGFAGPEKIPRLHVPARREQRGSLAVYVFAEEEIVPWIFEEE